MVVQSISACYILHIYMKAHTAKTSTSAVAQAEMGVLEGALVGEPALCVRPALVTAGSNKSSKLEVVGFVLESQSCLSPGRRAANKQ